MGVRIRTAVPNDAGAIARVHVASWHATYRGLVPDEVIDARTVEVRREQWAPLLEKPNRITLVACDESGEVVGFASALLLDEPDRRFGSYLQTLYLVPDVKKQGIGRALLRAMAQRLFDGGIESMALRALRLNPARRFYEHLGARVVPEGIEHDADHYDDVVYAFDDVRVLL
ncbi:MAG TPA: GNAT family N-acetyltransferase [Candidatus Acidoferrales bacterium]|nr:GNAT family N-acetyltransferase [Candidatus Acidoferrales bacterium]